MSTPSLKTEGSISPEEMTRCIGWSEDIALTYPPESAQRMAHLRVATVIRVMRTELTARAWQPIETAPKDGSMFQAWLVAPNGQWWEHQCRYNDDEAFEVWGRIDYDEDGWDMPVGTPTHWMPEPEAPK